jgi:iron complex outermembrane recepter protein
MTSPSSAPSTAFRQQRRRSWLAGSILAVLWSAAAAPAAPQSPAPPTEAVDLTKLSMEELMDVEVVSVSKRAEPVSAAAAAIYVITGDDLRRSGATSLPEALRLVPGLEVARIDANKWAVTARGFNGRFANKLLVLVDGRSVYTPLFSGVFWDVQDTLLDDVERIEVIRGPGATLWGANAVDGVINIITRPAAATLGTLLTTGGGTTERGFLGLRHGGSLGAAATYRVYAKAFDREGGAALSGVENADRWSMRRGGFRVDWGPARSGELTVAGDLYDGKDGETLTVTSLGATGAPVSRTFRSESPVSGGNALARWRRTLSETADLTLQLYYDRTARSTAILGEDRDVVDLELQHGFAPGRRQRVVWGLGYRRTSDDIRNSAILAFTPARRTDDLASGFLQDEVTLRPDRLWLIVGSKLEHNDYTGFEVQPNVRAVWSPRRRHTLWAAVSRAVRTPSRAERDVRFDSAVLAPGTLGPGTPAAVVRTMGDPGFGSEKLVAYELGYRVGLAPGLFLDLATFYNAYDDLRTTRTEAPFFELAPAPHLVIPARLTNEMRGETRGVELTADWRASARWRLDAGYSFLDMRLRLLPGSNDAVSLTAAGQSPRHQLHLRSSLDLQPGLQLDLVARFVDRLPAEGVDRYTSLDLRLAWTPRPGLELALAGQDLLAGSHAEFGPDVIPTQATAVKRSGYGKLTWRF